MLALPDWIRRVIIDTAARIDIVQSMEFELSFQPPRIEKLEELLPWNAFVVHKIPRSHCHTHCAKRP